MRSLLLIGLVGAAACSHGDTGLALTLSAPNAPPGVDRIEVVMASPDAVTVENQRPGVTVRYYRQKSSAGVLDQLTALDGYSLRLEGRPGKGDEKFIPFVIAYAGSAPVAVGAVADPNGKPLAIVIPDSSRVEATVAMVPLKAVDPATGIASGQLGELRCTANSGGWRSGIVWQPPGDVQLRLVFPDPDGDSPLDASARPLDLDCDGYRPEDGDCDDLGSKFHPDAADTCDGQDTNCDGVLFALKQCNPSVAECGTDGVQLCRDGTSTESVGICQASPACRCRTGSGLPCSKCTLQFQIESLAVKPCSPAAGAFSLGGLGLLCSAIDPCTVEVVRYTDSEGWDIGVALGQGLEPLHSVKTPTNEIWLGVKSEQSTLPPPSGTSIGAIHLVISQGLASQAVGIDLELAPSRIDDCGAYAYPSGGVFKMTCQ